MAAKGKQKMDMSDDDIRNISFVDDLIIATDDWEWTQPTKVYAKLYPVIENGYRIEMRVVDFEEATGTGEDANIAVDRLKRLAGHMKVEFDSRFK